MLYLQTNLQDHIYIYYPILLLRRKHGEEGEGWGEGKKGTSSVYKRLVYVCFSIELSVHFKLHIFRGMKFLYDPKYYLNICKNLAPPGPQKSH